ncbi:hypothetical protein SDC9_21388 [bioreactor metagenome]|uniref:Uncharacterized protein n=1 Tax=bioreactor metagenome TaxID=1076179 RepID=A0A644U9S0_9ZZZZ
MTSGVAQERRDTASAFRNIAGGETAARPGSVATGRRRPASLATRSRIRAAGAS